MSRDGLTRDLQEAEIASRSRDGLASLFVVLLRVRTGEMPVLELSDDAVQPVR